MRMEEYIDTHTLAELVGVSRETVVSDINQGILSAEKRPDSRGARWGGCWFIHPDDAQKYIDMKKGVPQGSSISAREFGRRTGQDDRGAIGNAIKSGELPAFKSTNKRNSPWHILEEDARTYSERMGWEYTVGEKVQSNGHKSSAYKPIAVKPIKGTPDRCGSCGTEIGNILADMDGNTGKKYGYLCIKCDDFVRDRKRMYKVLKYLGQTRVNQVQCKI